MGRNSGNVTRRPLTEQEASPTVTGKKQTARVCHRASSHSTARCTMKEMKRAISKDSFSAKSGRQNLWIRGSLLLSLLMVFLLPGAAMAVQERFVLDFNDRHIRGHRGEPGTIFLKKSLKEQYPWVQVSDLELKKVVMVAKSKRGRGAAGLRVGKWATDMYEVGGKPRSFNHRGRSSFDRLRFLNLSHNSRGPWQLGLQGNFIVRKIVLVVENHNKSGQYGKKGRNRW